MASADIGAQLSKHELGWSDEEDDVSKPEKGINESLVSEMSWMKGEPDWMRKVRLKSLWHFERRPMPDWGGGLSDVSFDDILRHIDPGEAVTDDCADVPEAERQYRAGVTGRSDSEVAYGKYLENLDAQGVIFCDMDTALREHPEVVRAYFGKVIAPNDNKFSALNSAVWSGGSFIYVPPGVEVEMPLQEHFHMNARNMGQFERTLIIADTGSNVHYIEGCSAPVYSTDSLHAPVVEVVVKESARVTYTTIQNWSHNVFDLVTKRALVESEGHMQWIDGNIGSRLTVKHPAVVMVGPKASGEVLSVAYAGHGQHQNVGAEITHAAPETTSKIVSKSISKNGGRSSFCGLVRVDDDAHGCESHVQGDALILDEDSISDISPSFEVGTHDAIIGHEATLSNVADEQLFYLTSRGLSEEQAMAMIVNGFIEPVTRRMPMEYAVEWSRLIELEMEGSVG